MSGHGASADASALEHQVKAGFLHTFTRHVTWPAATFADKTSPIVIGLMVGAGPDPFAKFLEELAGTSKSPRPVQVRRLRGIEEAEECHIVFISKGESRNEARLFAFLKGKPVLTVGESPDTIEHGGMVSLILVSQHLRHEINVQAVSDGRLGLSSPMYANAKRLHNLAATP